MSLPHGFRLEDHTADMVLHGFGPLLEDSFTECALALFELMSPNSAKIVAHRERRSIEVSAASQEQLLFSFLNELLGGVWGEDAILVGHVEVVGISNSIDYDDDADKEKQGGEPAAVSTTVKKYDDDDDINTQQQQQQQQQQSKLQQHHHHHWNLRAVVFGEKWDKAKHEIGTEVKAITMHGLKVEQREEDMLFHSFCVVDI